MYEGSEIYANKISAAPLIKSTDFNMYGGKIFGNLLTSTKTASYSCGAIFVSNQFVAYDGKFCDNIILYQIAKCKGVEKILQKKWSNCMII